MKNGEIGPVPATSGFAQAPSGGYFPLRKDALEARRSQHGDTVELTEPHRAALRLLRERVLENTRLELELPRDLHPHIQFARIPGEQPRVFLGRLLSDQNLLASKRRGEWLDSAVDAALEEGLLQGMNETLEILHDLDRLDSETWRLVCSVLDDFYRRVGQVSPEALKRRLWDEV